MVFNTEENSIKALQEQTTKNKLLCFFTQLCVCYAMYFFVFGKLFFYLCLVTFITSHDDESKIRRKKHLQYSVRAPTVYSISIYAQIF